MSASKAGVTREMLQLEEVGSSERGEPHGNGRQAAWLELCR